MVAVKEFFPKTGTDAEWNTAYYRLEDYFRALRVVNKLQQSQIILRLLQSAAERHGVDPSQSPTALAMDEARKKMDQWFQEIFGQREQLSVVGLISLLAADAPEKRPLAFLAQEVTPDFRTQLLECDVRAGPDLQVSSMTPRPIDVGPLLAPINLSETIEKARRGVNMFAAALAFLALVSISIFLLSR
jgi:hypothetical protein